MKHNFTWVLLDCRAQYVYHLTGGDIMHGRGFSTDALARYRDEVGSWLRATGTGVWVDKFKVALKNEQAATAFLLRWSL